jgi:hypothetical protein
MPARRFFTALATALTLVALLAACTRTPQTNPNVQSGNEGASDVATLLNLRNNPAEVAAVRASRPFQYREREPLNLLDFRTNLNPNSNR